MLLDWGVAEVTTPRFADWPRADVIAKVRIGIPLNAEESEALVQAVWQKRQPMLGYFFKNSTTWVRADFPMNRLGMIRSDIWFQADDTLARVAANRSDVRIEAFSIEAMLGRPIIVGPNANGPWSLIEGTHRCAEILRMSPASQPASIPIIAGLCEKIGDWERRRN